MYRLVEVTTALQEYDEALEYYTEYVQAAPHDNNRYILKYKLYRGRGSSVEELIADSGGVSWTGVYGALGI